MNEACAEHVAIPVSDGRSLTPYVFYHHLIPALRTCLLERKPSLISLDMTDVASVSPLVLPNLVVVGKILCEHFGTPGNLILSTRNLEMLQFLKGMGFFSLLDQHNFFAYDENFVCGISGKVTGDLATVVYVPPTDLSAEEIFHQVFRDNRSINRFIDHLDSFSMARVFARTVGELTYNSSAHGRSPAVISAYGGPKLGLHCAVSDCGIGYLSSLLEHPADLLVYSESEMQRVDRLSNFRAIIEAVCRRLGHETYGVSTVIRDIAGVGGVTRVHSFDTQVVFTPRNQSRLAPFRDNETIDSRGRELGRMLLALADRADSLQSSPVRIRESRLAGVHIEFELPPAGGAARGDAYD